MFARPQEGEVLHFGSRCYTLGMPTTRPRHMITETDRLTHALDVAAAIYPELESNRGALLRRVLDVGIDAVLAHDTQVANARKQRILELSQQMSGVWPENWREELLTEWPQ